MAEWSRALGLTGPRPYLGYLAGAIAAAAQRDGVLLTPEPGFVAIAFAHRDRETEQEVALGWGFRPDAARYLVVHACQALPMDRLAGEDPQRLPPGTGQLAGRRTADDDRTPDPPDTPILTGPGPAVG